MFLTLSVSTALQILSQDLSWTICSHLWMEDLNQLLKPVKASILASLSEKRANIFNKAEEKEHHHPVIPGRHVNTRRCRTNLSGRNSRKPLRIFREMKSSKMVSPIVWVILELSCSRVPQTLSIATFTSSATCQKCRIGEASLENDTAAWLTGDVSASFFKDVPVFPTACTICWRSLPSPRCENKQKRWHDIKPDKYTSMQMNVPQLSCRRPRRLWTSACSQLIYLPVKELVVDVLGPLHVCTHGIDHLNQLLELLLQSLQNQDTTNMAGMNLQGSVCESVKCFSSLTARNVPLPLVYSEQLSFHTTQLLLSVDIIKWETKWVWVKKVAGAVSLVCPFRFERWKFVIRCAKYE